MKIIKANELPWENALQKGAYWQQRKALGTGALSSGLWRLPPGKTSFPMHAHQVTEEAMFVVSGRAKVRTPEGVTEVGPGDYVAFPAGGLAHQLVNDSTEDLVYLGLSATKGFDAVEYPESKKVAVALGTPPTGKRLMFRVGDQVDYFAGDPGVEEPVK